MKSISNMIRHFFRALRLLFRNCWFETMDSEEYVRYLRSRGIKVGENVRFRYPGHTLIDQNRPTLVEFGDNIDINDNFTLLTHDFGTYALRGKYGDFVNSSGRVRIGNNVVIGRDVTILKGVEIGDNTIIGLGAVVTKSTPPNSVITGMPARVVSSIDDYYKKRKDLQVEEALEFAASIIVRKKRQLRIEDFYEEWVLFLTEDEYNNNPKVRQFVDYRLGKYISKEVFFSQKKHFNGFDEFVKAAHEYLSRNCKN